MTYEEFQQLQARVLGDLRRRFGDGVPNPHPSPPKELPILHVGGSELVGSALAVVYDSQAAINKHRINSNFVIPESGAQLTVWFEMAHVLGDSVLFEGDAAVELAEELKKYGHLLIRAGDYTVVRKQVALVSRAGDYLLDFRIRTGLRFRISDPDGDEFLKSWDGKVPDPGPTPQHLEVGFQ